VWNSCNLFLWSNLDRVIKTVNFKEQMIQEFNFDLLSESFGLCKPMLRKCLFGSLIYFICSPSRKTETILTHTIVSDFNNLSGAYLKRKEVNIALIEKHVQQLSQIFTTTDINDAFCEKIAEFFNLNAKEVGRICSFYFNSLVITKDNQLVSFPRNTGLVSRELVLDHLDKDILVLFTKGIVDKKIVNLLSESTNYKLYHYFPKLYLIEYRYIYEVYLKKNLEIGLKYLITILPNLKQRSFKLKFLGEKGLVLDWTSQRSNLETPFYFGPENGFIIEALFNFYQSLVDQMKFSDISSMTNPSKQDIISSLNLHLLHHLGYIDLNNRSINIMGAAWAESNPSVFQEELIILFELIRNNLFPTDIVIDGVSLFRNFETFMSENVFDDLLYSSEKSIEFINTLKMAKYPKHKAENVLDFIDESFSEDVYLSSFKKDYQKSKVQLLRIGLTKSLTIFYRCIKMFQHDYQSYYKFEKGAFKADIILNRAFDNYAFRKISIAGKFMMFSIQDFNIDDVYAHDSFEFQQVLLGLQKGLRFLTNSMLVSMVFQTGHQKDIEFVQSLFGRLPFYKHYSIDACNLSKIIFVKFLIYKALCTDKDPFADVYVRLLQFEHLRDRYGVCFDLLERLVHAQTMLAKLHFFLTSIARISKNEVQYELTKELPAVFDFYDEVIAFFRRHINS